MRGSQVFTELPEAIARFVAVEPPDPGYLALLRNGELERRVVRALEMIEECAVCPRNCGVDRLHAVPPPSKEKGTILRGPGRRVPAYIPPGTACFTGRYARVASAFAHFGEEDCLRGWRGSGTIFFSFCNLRCVFCQNWEVSQEGEGEEYDPQRLAAIMLKLQALGCHNINLVTPEHVVPQVVEAIYVAAQHGLRLPIVYNTSAYDSLESLRLLEGLVDIYMPDFKYWNADSARRYLKAADYPAVARESIREMHRQVGPLQFDRDGIARRGLLVRHLVMPGAAADAREILRFLAEGISPDTYINLMEQYRPAGAVLTGKYPELQARGPASLREELLAEAYRFGLWRFDQRWR